MWEVRTKESFDILIPQISVFTLIQHTFSSMHSLLISSIDAQPLNTLWEICFAPKVHENIGYKTFNIFDPFYTHWLYQTYVVPKLSSLDQGHSLEQRNSPQQS